MTSMYLNEDQIDHFHKNGYLVIQSFWGDDTNSTIHCLKNEINHLLDSLNGITTYHISNKLLS